nr:MBOAT family protein [Lachnospiraceae bacterium]
MSFVSFEFAAFVAVCLILYHIFPKRRRYILLLAASYAFYVIACGGYIIYILLTTVTTYAAGLVMSRFWEECDRQIKDPETASDRAKKKAIKAAFGGKVKAVMIVCLVFNFGILIVLKYSAFVISNINLAMLTFWHSTDFIRIPSWVLPLGLSFYTFQSMGYIIDIFYRRIEAEKHPLKLALFVSFFPQIVQGPIGRYKDLSATLYEGHDFDFDLIRQGALLIMSGLFKKLIIADRVADYITNSVNLYESTDGGYLLLALFLYSFQLYADFSGGIDIASGVACCFGVKLAPNFMRPFFARSVSEYWRRWHISLSDWFRDFIFYPIAVSKRMMKHGKWLEKHVNVFLGKRYTLYVATAIVWFTTGLWHGAEWRYVIWGLLNGFIMCLSAELEP